MLLLDKALGIVIQSVQVFSKQLPIVLQKHDIAHLFPQFARRFTIIIKNLAFSSRIMLS